VEEIRRSAPSVEEAIEAALAELGITEQDALIQVVREPKSGILGIGSQDAEVVVRVRRSKPAEADDALAEQGEIAADFVDGLLARMGIEATVDPAFEDGTMYVDVLGEGPDDDDMGLLIGRYGQTLEAIQELTRGAVIQRTGERSRVVVDVEDYKRRQRDRLEQKAHDAAERVARTGKSETLDPMNPFERKLVHDVVASVPGVTSASTGEDPDRRVVISPNA
jgi:spoIIIJ-associated protein